MEPRPDDPYIEAVLREVCAVELGHVTTYGAIAAAMGRGGPRQVGRVMRLHGDAVAWWRVVRADGSPPACHGKSARDHLRDEGVRFLPDGRIDMAATRE